MWSLKRNSTIPFINTKRKIINLNSNSTWLPFKFKCLIIKQRHSPTSQTSWETSTSRFLDSSNSYWNRSNFKKKLKKCRKFSDLNLNMFYNWKKTSFNNKIKQMPNYREFTMNNLKWAFFCKNPTMHYPTPP